MQKKKVLFICVHNSARSQIAEAFLKQMADDRFSAESAGLEPGELNPLAVKVMEEEGVDISQNKTKSVVDFYKQGNRYDYVITVCDESQAGKCPVFPAAMAIEMIHWNFDDPASFCGTLEEKLEKTRRLRDEIKQKIKQFIKEK